MGKDVELRRILADWVRKELLNSPLDGPHVSEITDVGLSFDPSATVGDKGRSGSVSMVIEGRVGRGTRWHWVTGSETVAGSISTLLCELFTAAKLTAEDLRRKEGE